MATTPTSITVCWTAPSDHGDGGRAYIYDTRYSTSPISESNWSDLVQAIDEPTPGSAGSTDSLTIGGLSPETWYYIALKSADQALNWSGMSNVVYAKTQSLHTEELPNSFTLGQNYPNPFNPSTSIDYSLPYLTHVQIDIFNILGQHIVTIVDEVNPAGYHTATWDGVDSHGHDAPSGVFFYRIKTKDFTETRKMMLVK